MDPVHSLKSFRWRYYTYLLRWLSDPKWVLAYETRTRYFSLSCAVSCQILSVRSSHRSTSTLSFQRNFKRPTGLQPTFLNMLSSRCDPLPSFQSDRTSEGDELLFLLLCWAWSWDSRFRSWFVLSSYPPSSLFVGPKILRRTFLSAIKVV